MARVVLIEEDPDAARLASSRLQGIGHTVIGPAARGEQGLALVREHRPDLALLDIALSGEMNGARLAAILLGEPRTPLVFMGTERDPEVMRRMASFGSQEFLAKPFTTGQLRASIDVALRSYALRAWVRPPPAPPDPAAEPLPTRCSAAVTRTLLPTSRGKIIGTDPRVVEALEIVGRVAPTNATVLITGESGTGKELIAAALHDASPRRDAALVAVNCGAIPETLVEAELFGHTKGAFTGAVADRLGLVAAAEGGSLLLDEIGEMPLSAQVRLLRLIQQREYTPVGAAKAVRCDVRIVAATHRNLEEEVAAGRFRQDLYYRLNVVHVDLPPLRERRGDLPTLANHFLRVSLERAGRSEIRGLSPEALEALVAYDWPGNIRSLENVVERVVLLAPGPWIELVDLPPKLRERGKPSGPPELVTAAGVDFRAAVEQYERTLITQALAITKGNKRQAAQLLGLNRTTLLEMMKRKGIT